MARKGLIESNERKKKLVDQAKAKRLMLKTIIMNRDLPLEERFEATLKLTNMPRNTAGVRVRARCIETGRPRGVYRFCGLSRMVLRHNSVRGCLPGVRRSSW